jgi:cell division protein FtsL
MSIDVEYAIKQDVKNNPIVREIDRQQRREFLRTLGVTALIVAMLLFSAWQHFRVVNTSRELETLRTELAREMEFNRQLRLDLETLRRPQELERRAIQELHMQTADPAATIVIERVPARPAGSTVIASR